LLSDSCAECFHPYANHGVVCSGSIECFCPKFVKQELFDFAADIEKFKHQATTIKARCLHMIQKLPHLGSDKMSDKSFAKVYKSYWHAFWPSRNTVFTRQKYLEMPDDGSITREKRRILNEEHPELKIFDKVAAVAKQAKFQAYMELAVMP